MTGRDVTVDRVATHVYSVPTDRPESDATFAWDATTVVIVEIDGGGEHGLGYTYGPRAVAAVIDDQLADIVRAGPVDPERVWTHLHAAVRNAGQSGVGAMAIAAVDLALHDLRARLLGLSLSRSLGGVRDAVPIYGSGGFTSYADDELAEQLAGWVGQGIRRVKMKVGRRPAEDPRRLTIAREAIGTDAELMVDANGAFAPREAIAQSQRYAEFGVSWLEEPVTQDDPEGLYAVRRQAPPGMAIASGEYNWSRYGAARLLAAHAVDVVQADVTRCCGPTELRRIDALCGASGRPLSLHCAPAASAHVGCALERLIHLEYFHDHVRVEGMLFDGALEPVDGALAPDPAVAGHGLSLREEAMQYAVA
jgi:L-alanine-DL-glutamate epimerase-like enolase superfamily enzyme